MWWWPNIVYSMHTYLAETSRIKCSYWNCLTSYVSLLSSFHSSLRILYNIYLKILLLMMQLELYYILFFIHCLKVNNAFSIQSYVSFSNSNTRSATHLKLKHSLSKTHAAGHFYFNRLPRLWNSLPPVKMDLSSFDQEVSLAIALD